MERETTAPVPTGRTHVLGIVGHPVAQALAPETWTTLFRAHGIDAVCVPMDVAPADLPGFLAGTAGWRTLDGLIVTVPHKPAALVAAHEPSDRARLVGAVNVLSRASAGRWAGEILDGEGFADAVEAEGHEIAGRRVLVVGAGGVGTAIAFALGTRGAAEVVVADLDPDRVQRLGARLRAAGVPARGGPPVAEGFGLVVNATPLGTSAGDPIAVDCSGLGPSTVVGDVVARPEMTPLIALARDRGCPVVPGIRMLRAQLTTMARLFGYPEIARSEAGR